MEKQQNFCFQPKKIFLIKSVICDKVTRTHPEPFAFSANPAESDFPKFFEYLA